MKIFEFITPPMLLTLFGAILVAIGTFWATVQDNNEKLIRLKERSNFEEELKIKSEKIAKLNEDIKNYIIGEGSYCYLSLAIFNKEVATFVLIHEGKYPLYDVSLRIVDVDEFNKIPSGQKFFQREKCEKSMSIGTVNPGQGRMFGEYDLSNYKHKNFNIFFYARNGTFTQTMKLKRTTNGWVSTTQVKKDDKVLLTKSDPNYPLDSGEKEETGRTK